MKTFTLLLLLSLPFVSFSQQIGIKAGGTYATTSGNLKSDYGKGTVRFHGGLFVRENKGAVNILFEAFYNNIELKNGLEIHSLNLPLMIESNNRLQVQGGFNTSIHLKNKRKELFEHQANLRPFNIDLAAGLNFKATNDLGFNLRAHYPLLDQSGDEERNYRPIVFLLSLNYALKK